MTCRVRAIENARDTPKFDRMLKILGHMATHEELKKAALLLFVPDVAYDRGDVSLAMKVLEMENHWGQYKKERQ